MFCEKSGCSTTTKPSIPFCFLNIVGVNIGDNGPKKMWAFPYVFFNLLRDNIGGTVTKKRLAVRFVV